MSEIEDFGLEKDKFDEIKEDDPFYKFYGWFDLQLIYFFCNIFIKPIFFSWVFFAKDDIKREKDRQ